MKTDKPGDIAQTDSNSTSDRLRKLNTVEKPAKTGKLRLLHTLGNVPKDFTERRREVSFHIQQWVWVRLMNARLPDVLNNWFMNARYLQDPDHGEFTQERFLAKWEKIVGVKDRWIDRDEKPTRQVKFYFPETDVERIWTVAEFLGVDAEVVLVGILAHEALTRYADTAPAWSDITMIRAGQANAGGES